ncbi:MAG: hypothetical protein Q9216_001738 [Gyalolechia sp. 2 TL-2023]
MIQDHLCWQHKNHLDKQPDIIRPRYEALRQKKQSVSSEVANDLPMSDSTSGWTGDRNREWFSHDSNNPNTTGRNTPVSQHQADRVDQPKTHITKKRSTAVSEPVIVESVRPRSHDGEGRAEYYNGAIPESDVSTDSPPSSSQYRGTLTAHIH